MSERHHSPTMPSPTPLYDYNEVEDIIDQARSRKPTRRGNEPQASHVKRDISRYHYPTGYPCPQMNPPVEYSLDKRKRWEEIREIHETNGRNSTQVVVDLCTPFRGSIWWYVLSGAVSLSKLTRRLISEPAVKGKSKNVTLVSHVTSPDLAEPIFKFSIVRCYSDSTYHSQLLKYRRRLDRTKRKSSSKIHGKLPYDDDDV